MRRRGTGPRTGAASRRARVGSPAGRGANGGMRPAVASGVDRSARAIWRSVSGRLNIVLVTTTLFCVGLSVIAIVVIRGTATTHRLVVAERAPQIRALLDAHMALQHATHREHDRFWALVSGDDHAASPQTTAEQRRRDESRMLNALARFEAATAELDDDDEIESERATARAMRRDGAYIFGPATAELDAAIRDGRPDSARRALARFDEAIERVEAQIAAAIDGEFEELNEGEQRASEEAILSQEAIVMLALLAIAVSVWLIRRANRAILVSVAALTRAARSFGSGDRAPDIGPLPIAELDALGRAFCDMARRREEAEAADETKSRFVANMSHEIRTPLTAILGFAEMLLDADLSRSDALDALQTIHRNSLYLIRIINDVLDLSRIEAGKLDVDRTRFSPVTVVEDVAELLRGSADAKGVALTTRFVGSIPEVIESDPTRLKQILVNIVGNAVKFTDAGRVEIATRAADRGMTSLQFSVVDTGIGMSAGDVERLFKPFAQVDSSTTRQYGGTGLGLSISKHLAEALGGTITVESTPGAGSTFRATIATGNLQGVPMLDEPCVRAAGAATAKPAAPDAGSLACRVLLVEDGIDNQRLISFVLRKAGVDVAIAENGKIGYERALAAEREGSPYDVVLMDMQMPVMDGYEATRKLREASYTRPIIALTANAMAEDRQRCIDAGCDDYATKPIDRTRLLETLGRCAQGQRRAA